jgi:branched-chain amino acid transport system ATP-binding protein
LNMRETVKLSETILRIRERGITVMLVEHDMSLVMEISDEVLVLNYGRKIAEGRPKEIQRHPDVIAAYLGEETQNA